MDLWFAGFPGARSAECVCVLWWTGVQGVFLALTHWAWLGKAACCQSTKDWNRLTYRQTILMTSFMKQVTAVLSPVLSSVPASQEIGPLGDRVSAGFVSGDLDHRSDLRHPHRQRARRRILPRHHRESLTPRSFSPLSCCFSTRFLASLCTAEFRSVPGHRRHPPSGKPQVDGEFSKQTHT